MFGWRRNAKAVYWEDDNEEQMCWLDVWSGTTAPPMPFFLEKEATSDVILRE